MMVAPAHDPLQPPVPNALADQPVRVWRQPVTLPTYQPHPPSPFPAFFDSRVYQGSSGRVYPLPFYERISTSPEPVEWDAVHVENKFLRVVVLPQLGGRIHLARDLSRDYDMFYRQDVIKPALVGLAGPWLSGGVEFNWPQHHRPRTFLPTSCEIERHTDGSATVWCSDHDAMQRMDATHGIRIHPERSWIEVVVRLHNRSELVQTFHWWANVAAEVNDRYQSFFPPDVTYVADHANRATVAFPKANGPYYGIDYPERVGPEHPDADRLDWYRNIPVPTSYMVLRSDREFFGGYDHGVGAGFVHWAPKEVSPGKKQWTWGTEAFGKAWDRNLSDSGAPYVELMAGVYTNNQPDFSFLAPGETKTFSQLWYPIGEIGVPNEANEEAAVSLTVEGGTAYVGVVVTKPHRGLGVVLRSNRTVLHEWSLESLGPERGFVGRAQAPESARLGVEVHDGDRVLLTYEQSTTVAEQQVPPPAAEPLPPAELASADQLYVAGTHLAQYRHATRSPEPYWSEALRRDPGDQRCNAAMGLRRYAAASYDEAAQFLEAAVARSNTHNLNPRDGEAHYLLGLTRARQDRTSEARDLLARAAWDAHWFGPSETALTRLELREGRHDKALWHADRAATVLPGSPDVAMLGVVARAACGKSGPDAGDVARAHPLHAWSRWVSGNPVGDAGELLDVALEFRSVGMVDEALSVLDEAARAAQPEGSTNVLPLIAFHRARMIFDKGGDGSAALAAAETLDATWCLPVRLDDVDVLRWATLVVDAPLAHYLLGCWEYHHERTEAARTHWQRSLEAREDPMVLRNLGVDAYNHRRDPSLASEYYARAAELLPDEPQLLSEKDQLAARRCLAPRDRLAALQRRMDLVEQRDDLAVTYARLLVLVDQPSEALRFLAGRQFQPAEGGEGRALAAWEAASLLEALRGPAHAEALMRAAIDSPPNLGEARHPLENAADLWLALGDARAAAGDDLGAEEAWRTAAGSVGDFQSMAVTSHSEQTFHAIVAARRLGDEALAHELLEGLRRFIEEQAVAEPSIDFFATSLPELLLFQQDAREARDQRVAVLRAQQALLTGEDLEAVDEALRLAPDDLALHVSRAVLG